LLDIQQVVHAFKPRLAGDFEIKGWPQSILSIWGSSIATNPIFPKIIPLHNLPN